MNAIDYLESGGCDFSNMVDEAESLTFKQSTRRGPYGSVRVHRDAVRGVTVVMRDDDE